MRGEAAQALGEIGRTDRTVLGALRQATSDEAAEVRFFAAFAWGRLRDRAARLQLTSLLSDHAQTSYGSVADEARHALERCELTER